MQEEQRRRLWQAEFRAAELVCLYLMRRLLCATVCPRIVMMFMCRSNAVRYMLSMLMVCSLYGQVIYSTGKTGQRLKSQQEKQDECLGFYRSVHVHIRAPMVSGRRCKNSPPTAGHCYTIREMIYKILPGGNSRRSDRDLEPDQACGSLAL